MKETDIEQILPWLLTHPTDKERGEIMRVWMQDASAVEGKSNCERTREHMDGFETAIEREKESDYGVQLAPGYDDDYVW